MPKYFSGDFSVSLQCTGTRIFEFLLPPMRRSTRSPHRPPSLVPIFERHFKELDVWFQAQVDLSVGGGVFRTLSLSSLSAPLIRDCGGGGGSGKGQKTGGGSGSGEIAGGTDGGQGEAGRVESKGELPLEGASVGTRVWVCCMGG